MIDESTINKCLWEGDEKKVKHFRVITDFLNHVTEMSKKPSLILKGGTALMVCYGLDRFSEDIDFDGIDHDAERYVKTFCEENGYWYRVGKDTDHVKRYLIHHDEELKPLKVEISYRRKDINPNILIVKNNVYTYTIGQLFTMKMNAYDGRDRLRDLYDVTFIFKNYHDQISEDRIEGAIDILSRRGLEQFDYLMSTQNDDLVDKNKLADDFLDMFDSLHLVDEREIEDDIEPEQEQDHGPML